MNVVDSSGWIEYFQDTPRADLFAAAIEDRARLLVPTISLFEVHRVLSRALPAEMVETCLDVMRRGRVLDLTDRRAIAASEAATRHGLALADAA
ncbi:MAG: type II toxin-antitoxin system VapC family toxin, partial [Polaromonas sp.]